MRALLLIVATGCGFQIGAGSVDAPPGTVDAAKPVDATPIDTVPPVPCIAKWLAHTVSLDAPVPVAGINLSGQSERDPTLTSDERVIFWVGPGPFGNDDVFQATRGSSTASFGTTVRKLSLSDDFAADSKVTLTADDLLGFQSTQRAGGSGEFDLWRATRVVGGTGIFNPLDRMYVGALNDGTNQLDPFVSADGLELYYALGDPQRIVVARRSSETAAFEAPVDVTGINGPRGEADPALSADGRVLLFTTERTGGFDFADIWYATRADVAEDFGAPVLVPTINGLHADGDPHLSVDGCRLYFASARTNSTYDLMLTTVQ